VSGHDRITFGARPLTGACACCVLVELMIGCCDAHDFKHYRVSPKTARLIAQLLIEAADEADVLTPFARFDYEPDENGTLH
jgi:hypothetical protein